MLAMTNTPQKLWMSIKIACEAVPKSRGIGLRNSCAIHSPVVYGGGTGRLNPTAMCHGCRSADCIDGNGSRMCRSITSCIRMCSAAIEGTCVGVCMAFGVPVETVLPPGMQGLIMRAKKLKRL